MVLSPPIVFEASRSESTRGSSLLSKSDYDKFLVSFMEMMCFQPKSLPCEVQQFWEQVQESQ